MNFSPYHAFRDCKRLENRIEAIRAAGHIPDDVFERYELYHYSLIHKLRSARYHIEALRGFLQTQTPNENNLSEIAYRVNFHFDGFVHLLGSSGDIFAREILTYFGEILPAKVYFYKAHTRINTSRPGDAILPLLLAPGWKSEFDDYRNTSTHESLIGTGFSIEIEMHGHNVQRRLKFPLPDDPRANVKTYTRNPDIVRYCEVTLTRYLRLFNQAYSHLVGRISATGSLPI